MSSLPVTKAAASAARLVLHTDTSTVEVPPSAFALDGFRAWAVSDAFPERGRVCYLDGELFIDMSAEKIAAHGQVKLEISTVLSAHVKKRKLGMFFPDRTLLSNTAAGLSTEPDGCFAFWKTLRAGRVLAVPLEDEEDSLQLEGTPDWVLEVVSDTSVRKDTQRLRQLYHRAEIPEYWLVDARGEEVDFQLLVWAETGYENVTPMGRGWLASRVFRREFRLIRRRNPIALWEYTLQVKRAR